MQVGNTFFAGSVYGYGPDAIDSESRGTALCSSTLRQGICARTCRQSTADWLRLLLKNSAHFVVTVKYFTV